MSKDSGKIPIPKRKPKRKSKSKNGDTIKSSGRRITGTKKNKGNLK